jgi:hypothetical protein
MPNVRLPDGTTAKLAKVYTIQVDGVDIERVRVKIGDNLRSFNLEDCQILWNEPLGWPKIEATPEAYQEYLKTLK